MLTRALATIAATALATPALAQANRPDPTTAWLSLGAGPGDFGGSLHDPARSGSSGLFHGALTLQRHRAVVSLRATSVSNILADQAWDLGLLVGLGTRPGQWHASAGAGIGVAGGTQTFGIFGKPPQRIANAVAFPIEVQLSWRPTKVFGIGLYGSGSVRRGQHQMGLAIGVLLGDLR